MPPWRRTSSPIMALSVVDLPAPLRPIRPTTSPRPTSRLISCKICAAPYQACRPETDSTGALLFFPRLIRLSLARCLSAWFYLYQNKLPVLWDVGALALHCLQQSAFHVPAQ